MADTNTPVTGAPGDKSRRWPKVLLALSLTLNLAVLGLVAGANLRDDRDTRRFPPPDRGVMADAGFRPFFEAMPRNQRNRLGAALRDRAGGLAPDRDALAADLRDMLAVMRDEPFDAAALEALLSAQHARMEARTDAGRAVLVDQIGAMSADQRQAYADRLESRFANALARRPGPPPRGGGGAGATGN